MDEFAKSTRKTGERYSDFMTRLFEESGYVNWKAEGRNGAMEVWRVFGKNCTCTVLKNRVDEVRREKDPGSNENKSYVMAVANTVDKSEMETRDHLVAKVDVEKEQSSGDNRLDTLTDKLEKFVDIWAVQGQSNSDRGRGSFGRGNFGRGNWRGQRQQYRPYDNRDRRGFDRPNERHYDRDWDRRNNGRDSDNRRSGKSYRDDSHESRKRFTNGCYACGGPHQALDCPVVIKAKAMIEQEASVNIDK